MRSLVLIFVTAWLVCGCSDPPSNNGQQDTGASDSGRDAVVVDDTSSTEDMASGDVRTLDIGVDLGREDMAVDDVGGEVDQGADASSDAADLGTDPFAGRPPGQCVRDSDCPVGPNGQSCSRALPGGACLGCGSDDHCPDGDDWTSTCSQFGACVSDCDTDEDCPPGTECGVSGCSAIDCVNDVCPVGLFGCSDSGRCARVDCTGDPGVCPDGTTCLDDYCVEDRALD